MNERYLSLLRGTTAPGVYRLTSQARPTTLLAAAEKEGWWACHIAGQVVTENGAAKAPSLQFAELAEACSVPLSLLNDAYAAVRRLDHEGQARVLHLLGILGVAACRIGNERQRLVAKLDRIAQITMEN